MPSHPAVAMRNLSSTYAAAAEPLFNQLTAHFPMGFAGIVGANDAGKSTLLRLVSRKPRPTLH